MSLFTQKKSRPINRHRFNCQVRTRELAKESLRLTCGRCPADRAGAAARTYSGRLYPRGGLPLRCLGLGAVPPSRTGRLQKPLERLLRSHPKVCAGCASTARPPPCHAACMKQAPYEACLYKRESPLFVSSPRPKRPSPLTSNASTFCSDSHCLSRVYGRRSRREIRALVGAAPSAGTPPPPPPWNVPLSL